MKEQTLLFGKKILFASIFLLITISVVQSFGSFQNPVNASVSVTPNNTTADNNSTFSQSDLNKDKNDIGMTIVIPSSNSNSNTTSTTQSTSTTNTTTTSESVSKGNESIAQDNNVSNSGQLGTDNLSSFSSSSSSSAIPEKGEPTNKTSTNSNSNQSSNLQRGEYKVDENGIHYYNINNCSETKGSSGIGDLSECEDAEREMREE